MQRIEKQKALCDTLLEKKEKYKEKEKRKGYQIICCRVREGSWKWNDLKKIARKQWMNRECCVVLFRNLRRRIWLQGFAFSKRYFVLLLFLDLWGLKSEKQKPKLLFTIYFPTKNKIELIPNI